MYMFELISGLLVNLHQITTVRVLPEHIHIRTLTGEFFLNGDDRMRFEALLTELAEQGKEKA